MQCCFSKQFSIPTPQRHRGPCRNGSPNLQSIRNKVQYGLARQSYSESAGRASTHVVQARPSTDLPSETYDYIIVGGGLSGCLLANRLSSDESKSVLLIEAGEDNKDPIVKAPAGILRLFKHPTLDWNLETITQATMGGRASYLARGKLLGGSSCTNATLYHRGSAADYDAWGIPGWTADDVLPWFVAAEDNPAFGDTKYHSTGGSMHVEYPIYQNTLFKNHFQAAEQAGLKPNPDFNDWSRPQEGFGTFQVSITARGRRADGYRQFLKPILDRENLTVVTRTQVAKVEFETRGGVPTAVGVQLQSINPGTPVRPTGAKSSASLKAGGEIILAAGAVHSPQILLASGVGASSHLAEHGISVVSDVAGVGENLQDHPGVVVSHKLQEDCGPICATDHVYDDNANVKPLQLLNWAIRGKGPLTSTGCDRGAFVRSKDSLAQPDLQLRYVAALALDPDGVSTYVKFGEMKAAGQIEKWPPGTTIQILACRPQSRGSVRLASPDISQRPAIDLAYLTDPAGADRESLRAGIRMARRLAGQAAWEGLIGEELHPGPDVESDAALDDFISRTMHSGNALVGTCAMGAREGGGVVDPEDLSVHGVAGLRVVDSSVIPQIPGGQTGAPTVMVAERAAAMLMNGRPSVAGAPAERELEMA